VTTRDEGNEYGAQNSLSGLSHEIVIRRPFWETGLGQVGFVAVLVSPLALLLPMGETGTGGIIGLGLFLIGYSAFRPTLVITPDLVVLRRRFPPMLTQANRAQIRRVDVYNYRAEFIDEDGGIVLTMKPVWRSMKKYAEVAALLGAELADSRFVEGSWRDPYRGD
jgi:hypothetical protein